MRFPPFVVASEAKQSSVALDFFVAALLAMTKAK
jgi:hypothetical protein